MPVIFSCSANPTAIFFRTVGARMFTFCIYTYAVAQVVCIQKQLDMMYEPQQCSESLLYALACLQLPNTQFVLRDADALVERHVSKRKAN